MALSPVTSAIQSQSSCKVHVRCMSPRVCSRLHVCGMHIASIVSCAWLVCCTWVARVLHGCDMYVACVARAPASLCRPSHPAIQSQSSCVLHVCCMCVACTLHVRCMYVALMLHVCCTYVACMLHVCCTYVACIARAPASLCCPSHPPPNRTPTPSACVSCAATTIYFRGAYDLFREPAAYSGGDNDLFWEQRVFPLTG